MVYHDYTEWNHAVGGVHGFDDLNSMPNDLNPDDGGKVTVEGTDGFSSWEMNPTYDCYGSSYDFGTYADEDADPSNILGVSSGCVESGCVANFIMDIDATDFLYIRPREGREAYRDLQFHFNDRPVYGFGFDYKYSNGAEEIQLAIDETGCSVTAPLTKDSSSHFVGFVFANNGSTVGTSTTKLTITPVGTAASVNLYLNFDNVVYAYDQCP